MEGVQVDEESWEKLRRIMGKWKVRGGVNIGRGKKGEWKGLAEELEGRNGDGEWVYGR